MIIRLNESRYYQTKTDNIYRVLRIGSMNGSPYDIGVTSVPFAPALENDFEGLIQSSTRAFPDRGLVKTENIEFYEDGLLFADANFFDFFSFPLLIGNKQSVLDSPNTVVISKSIAEKYFGFENPLGKTLKVDNTFELIVTGIMADVPNSSHLQFDIVLSLDIYRNARFYSHWWSNTLNTYVRIDSPQQANTVEGRFPDFMDKYFGEDFEASGTKIGLRLEPFSEIYFNKDTQYDMAIHGDLSTIYTLSIVAAVIMFIACFNYVNLAIAQSFQRAKEIAIRKVLGGEKVRLVFQMLSESLLIIITAIGISVALAILSFDSLKNLFRIQFELDWSDPNIVLFLAALLFGTLLVSGLYPALALSNLDSNRTLKGIVQRGMSGSLLRKGLVILQFALAIILISSTLIISKQINFIGNKDLGFDRSSVPIKLE